MTLEFFLEFYFPVVQFVLGYNKCPFGNFASCHSLLLEGS